MEFLKKKITKDQSRDTGMAMVLLCMLIWAAHKRPGYVYLGILLQVINMIVPQVFRPLAILWFGLAELMGTVMSKILLSIVFFFVVTPIALLRRLFGKDSLQLRAFKSAKQSAMVERNHTFVAADLERPY
jgi:ABC-type nitrate/sulfonate/bicarbonate transport system permease component